MDVIEKKYPTQKLYPYINILRFKDSPVDLLGTGGNASQLYPSDIDLFSKIVTNETAQSSYKEFIGMLDDIDERNDMYFIEFKVQDKDGMKQKFKSTQDIRNKFYEYKKFFNDNVDYCKFDFVLMIDGQFIELSIIYVFNKDPLDYDVLRISLSADMIDLIDEKKYYKSLKRLFAILKLDDPPDRHALVNISKLFNSKVGELYKKNSVLKAIKLFLETYPQDTKTAQYVLKNTGFSKLTEMDSIIDSYDNLINREGYKFYVAFYPYLLQIKDKTKAIKLRGGKAPSIQALDLLTRSNLEGGNIQTGSYENASNPLPEAVVQNLLGSGIKKSYNKKAWDIITDNNEEETYNRYDY